MSAELEERISTIEQMVSDIHAALFPDPDARVNEREFDEAIREARRGNTARLKIYLRSGGQVPEAILRKHRDAVKKSSSSRHPS
jgi:hypothetical protein